METTNAQRAQILTEALPYIQEYSGKIVVVKYGGNAMIDEELKRAVMGDMVLLRLIGVNVVLVHGGGPEITDMLQRVGKKSVFKNGLRVTDAETMEIVQMVLSGKINKGLVALLGSMGGRAVGLCGTDDGLIRARQFGVTDLGFVGEVTKVDPRPIHDMLDRGYIPVVSTVGCAGTIVGYPLWGTIYDLTGTYTLGLIGAAVLLAGAMWAHKKTLQNID